MTNADRTDVFRGLANPLRRRLLKRLEAGEVSAGDLGKAMRISPPLLARHLAILRETGLVNVRAQGRHRLYRLNTNVFERARKWVNSMKLPSGK